MHAKVVATPAPSFAMNGAVYEAIHRIEYPNKDAVWKQVVQMGRRYEKQFPTYKFVPRGGLSSPHVKYMTDIDFIFNCSQHGRVGIMDFDTLEALARQLCHNQVLSAKVAWQDDDLFDEDVTDLQAVRDLVASHEADVVVITGRYELKNGWQVPMDFTLQRGESKMPKAKRMARIQANLEEGNFAKVVSRIRSLLTPAKKGTFASEWNEVGGALRFLAKQLELVTRLPQKDQVSYMPYLCLPADLSAKEWCQVANKEMQAEAVRVLVKTKDLTGPVLGEQKEAIFALLDAAMEALSQEPSQSKSDGYPSHAGDESGVDQSRGTRQRGKFLPETSADATTETLTDLGSEAALDKQACSNSGGGCASGRWGDNASASSTGKASSGSQGQPSRGQAAGAERGRGGGSSGGGRRAGRGGSSGPRQQSD